MSHFIEFLDLILFAGPFVVFAGMGNGKDSGKLTFRGLTSSDNSVQFISDSNGITFSSSAGGKSIEIDNQEVVYGTGTGITSSFVCLDVRSDYKSITGPVIIQSDDSSVNKYNGDSSFFKRNSMIIGGNNNEFCTQTPIGKLCNSVIIGGDNNIDCGGNSSAVYSGGNVLLSNTSTCLVCTNRSSIISSSGVCVYKSCNQNSSIISSSQVCIYHGIYNSAIISSRINKTGSKLSSSVIISSCAAVCRTNTFKREPDCTAIMSSYKSNINDRGSSIISSYKSSIFGTCSSSNTVLSSECSIINNSFFSTIASTLKSCIDAAPWCYLSTNSTLWSPLNTATTIKYSSILAGSYNRIIISNTFSGLQQIANSVILAGMSNSIITDSSIAKQCSVGNVIISGNCNKIIGSLYSMASGFKSEIFNSQNSSIIASNFSSMTASNSIILNSTKSQISSRRSAIITSINSRIDNVYDSTIIGSTGSCIVATGEGKSEGRRNAIISSNRSCIKDNVAITIIGGYCNYSNGCYSSTLAGNYNTNCGKHSTIIGGSKNCIQDSMQTEYSGILGGCNNCTYNFSYRNVIIASRDSKIGYAPTSLVCNSVIIGGNGLQNCWRDSTMVSSLVFLGNSFVRGEKGLNATWSKASPTTIKVRGGLGMQ
jgi:hypothetical protein